MRWTGPWSFWRVLAVLGLVLSAAILSYPAAGDYFSRIQHRDDVFTYLDHTAALSTADIDRQLAAAHRYNDNLPNGPLRDPMVIDTDGNLIPIGLGRDAYNQALASPGGVMGRLTIPSIDVDLPIFHDTTAASLDAGVGHLYGSGLPVGGSGVHTVLTSHSGVVGSKLFTDLHKVQIGATFQITVLTEVLTYQVESIETVLPDQLDSLRQVPGRDLVTLVTCTPIGVNTHRLLVTGHRVPTPTLATADHPALTAPLVTAPGLPWWVLPVPATLVVVIWATRRFGPLAPPVTSPAGPWIDIVARRPHRRGLRLWHARRTQVLDAWLDHRLPLTAASVGQRFTNVKQAARFVKTAATPAVNTWTLKQGDGTSIAISAYAFASPAEARADAAHWIARQRDLQPWITQVGRDGSSWVVTTTAGEPVLFQVPVTTDPTTRQHAAQALEALGRARLPLDG